MAVAEEQYEDSRDCWMAEQHSSSSRWRSQARAVHCGVIYHMGCLALTSFNNTSSRCSFITTHWYTQRYVALNVSSANVWCGGVGSETYDNELTPAFCVLPCSLDGCSTYHPPHCACYWQGEHVALQSVCACTFIVLYPCALSHHGQLTPKCCPTHP